MAAQTLVQPIKGPFTGVYVVTGRVIDALGQPAARGEVVVELEQPGVRAAPLRAATDCFGVFLTSFDLRDVKPEGKVKVTFKGQGGPDATVTSALDAFHRRTDLKVRYQGEWGGGCPDQTHLWRSRVSVTGRVVNRTEPYQDGGVTYHARPMPGRAFVYFWMAPGDPVCPPSGEGGCDANAGNADERGDFRYSWVFDQPLNLTPEQRIEVVVDGKSHNFTIDPEWRVATALIETSGRGAPPPPEKDAPAAPLALALLVLAALALARRRAP